MQVQRLASLLKNQESHRMSLAKKYEDLEKSFNEQADHLREANIQISTLNEHFCNLEKMETQHKVEVSRERARTCYMEIMTGHLFDGSNSAKR